MFLLLSVISVIAMVLFLLVYRRKLMAYFSDCYNLGLMTWLKWIPVVCNLALALLVLSNFSGSPSFLRDYLTLKPFFGRLELFIFFISTPLMLTTLGNLYGLGVSGYTVAKLAMAHPLGSVDSGVLVFLGCAVSIALLCDKIPWLYRLGPLPPAFGWRLRKLVNKAFYYLVLGLIVASMYKIDNFAHWSSNALGFHVPTFFTFAFLVIFLFIWIFYFFSSRQHVVLIAFCLPSLHIGIYLCSHLRYLLVIGGVVYLILILTKSERSIDPVSIPFSLSA